jgi:hypothetical protein
MNYAMQTFSSAITGAGNAAARAAQTGSQVQWEMAQNAAMIGGGVAKMETVVWRNAGNGVPYFTETQAGFVSYENVRNFQEEGTTDYLGAVGGNPGLVSGASDSLAKQSMTGLAAVGQLGTSNQEQAALGMGGEVNGRSFFDYTNSVRQELDRTFGPGAVAAQYYLAQTAYSAVSDDAMQRVPNAQNPLVEDSIGAPHRAQQKQLSSEN